MLRIRLFGALEITGPDGVQVDPPREARELLAFLALEPERRFARDVVAGHLWGERSDAAARKALRNGLWRLRRALPAAGGPEAGPSSGRAAKGHGGQGGDPLAVGRLSVGLGEAVWVDVAEFRRSAAAVPDGGPEALAPETVTFLERAAVLYRGDLLEGLYAPWVTGPREELRLIHLDVLGALFRHDRRAGRLRRAIARGRELLRHDPLVERVHRELMLCHWLRGDRPLAVRRYRRCEAILRAELDLEPMPETRALLQRILDGTPPPPQGPPFPGAGVPGRPPGMPRHPRRRDPARGGRGVGEG